jgi:CDP-glycerol glycerophosphotransferase
MRFDVALTGRPMVFLVPDLDDYDSRTRGFLWDFGETAPGPWVRDTAGVVAELRDVDLPQPS